MVSFPWPVHRTTTTRHLDRSEAQWRECAVKGGVFQREIDPPGNWFVPPGNNRSSGRGDEIAGAFGVKGREKRLGECAGRNKDKR